MSNRSNERAAMDNSAWSFVETAIAPVDPILGSEPALSETPPAEDESLSTLPDGGYGWVVVAAASLVFFITFGYMNSYGVFQRLYTEEVFKDDATPATVSLIGSITTIISNCIGSPSGYLVDRIGIRTTVQIGAAIMSAGFVLASFSRQIWQLYITQGVIVGFGLCLAGFPCVAVPSYWFSRRRGLATGIVFAGSGLGGLALAPITQALINSVGVYWTLRVLALLVAVLAGTSSLFLRQYSSHRGRCGNGHSRVCANEKMEAEVDGVHKKHIRRDSSDSMDSATSADGMQLQPSSSASTPPPPPSLDMRQKKMYDFTKLRDIRFIYLLLASIFSSVAYFIPFMFIPIQATRLGYSTSSASALVSVINAGSVGGRVFGGVFADCVGSINALITSTIVQVLSLAVMWLPFHNSLPAFFAFAVAYGVSCGGYASILPVVIADIWGLNGLTGTVGLAYIGYAIGSGSGPPLAGLLLNATSGSDGTNFTYLIVFAAVVTAIATVFLYLLKRC